MDSVRERVIRLFQYLKEMKNLQEKIVRNLDEYETVWWQEDLVNMTGVTFQNDSDSDDVWLIVERPQLPDAPNPPSKLIGWISEWKQPDREPKPLSNKGKKEMFFNNQERVQLYETWLKETWKPWANEIQTKYRVKKVYDQLFTLYNRLQDERDRLEIVWGHGLLNWNVDDLNISRHLIVTPMELQFYPERGEFRLTSTSRGSYMETDMLTSTSFTHINRIHELIQTQDGQFLPRQEGALSTILQRVVHAISSDGQYISQLARSTADGGYPIISYSPAIFIRSKSVFSWNQELTDVIDKLMEGYPISHILTRLVSIEEEITAVDINKNEISADQLLFPLPANEQQKEIARKLVEHDDIVVQGPPGTGKSHTIANLICHLLAQGKRVLVTSEKERVLEVLRGKIPQEIRSLCVSFLGGDTKSLKELESSIRMISEQLSTRQLLELTRSINEYQQELSEVRKRINEIEEQMGEMLMSESKAIHIGEETITPLEAAKWLHDNVQFNWLPDKIPLEAKVPLKTEELEELIAGLSRFQPADRTALTTIRPETVQLPSPSEFSALIQDLQILEQNVEQNRVFFQEWDISGSVSHLLPPATRVVGEAILELQEIYRDSWQMSFLQRTSEEHAWQELIGEFRERLEWINSLDKALLEFEVNLPNAKSEASIKQDAIYVLDRMKQMKRTGRVFRRVTGRQYSYLFKECTVNGKLARERADFEIILDYIERNELKNRVALKWNRLMEDMNGPMVESTTPRLVPLLTECLEQIEYLLTWPTNIAQQLNPIIEKLGVPHTDYTQIEWYEDFHHALVALQDYFQWERLNQNYQQLHHILSIGKDSEYAHPCWNQLLSACQQGDVELWEQQYKELERLTDLQSEFGRFQDLYEKLRAYTPKWLTELEAGKTYQLEDFPKAWQWSQKQSWISKFSSEMDLEEMEKELHKNQNREAYIIRQLVADSTWKERLEKTTEKEKRSLIAWLQLIKRMGNGNQKKMDFYYKEAYQELNTCRSAIPVWIMPIQRVIENIKLDDDRFDVVIVDESSQSNLYALSTLLRGKKAIIVGDDGQVIPDQTPFDSHLNMELIERYLHDIPQSGHFDISASLYDTASRIIHNKVILKEHFRSVPAIIQFSNEFTYDNEMIPLRLPHLHEQFTPSVVAVPIHVENRKETSKGVNELEAIAIVEQIVNCCKDRKYAGKTFGVISLAGLEQAKAIEDRLRLELGEEEMVRRRIICGDAYRFQGDERDIVFLSLVVTSGSKPLTSELDHRMFTVATSRARDQLFLFHSVELSQLSPDCVRYALLKYCQDTVSGRTIDPFDMEMSFSSQFEQDVYDFIIQKGYTANVKVPIGVGKHLDIVIEGDHTRLAIECDGDKILSMEQWKTEFERQTLLERVGWHFQRICGSYFYQDPAKALLPVWEKCKELHILPKPAQEKHELETV